MAGSLIDLGGQSSGAVSAAVHASAAVDTVANIANCDHINFGEWRTIEVHVPSGSPITTLTVYSHHTPDGTYLPHNWFTLDTPATAIPAAFTVAAGNSYELTGVRAAKFLKLVGNAAGTVHLVLKS